jgi:hypothetical protein
MAVFKTPQIDLKNVKVDQSILLAVKRNITLASSRKEFQRI